MVRGKILALLSGLGNRGLEDGLFSAYLVKQTPDGIAAAYNVVREVDPFYIIAHLEGSTPEKARLQAERVTVNAAMWSPWSKPWPVDPKAIEVPYDADELYKIAKRIIVESAKR